MVGLVLVWVDFMETGKVVRFDENRGYGFIAPDNGGEDVFVHAKEINDLGMRVTTGTRVKFNVIEGGRGLKAYDIQVIGEEFPRVEAEVTPLPIAGKSHEAERNEDPILLDEDTCEVLSEREFTQQVTTLLLESASYLTGNQIIDIRKTLIRFARRNGWVED